MEQENQPTDSTKRQMVERILLAGRPEADFSDDDALFEQIIDDYADYARLLTSEHQQQDAQQEYKDNIESSMLALEDFRNAQGLQQDDIDRAIAALKEQGQNASRGIFTPAAIGNALKVLDYEKDIAAAELRGRNARIEEELSRPTQVMPRLGGGDAYQRAANSIFDLARQA